MPLLNCCLWYFQIWQVWICFVCESIVIPNYGGNTNLIEHEKTEFSGWFIADKIICKPQVSLEMTGHTLKSLTQFRSIKLWIYISLIKSHYSVNSPPWRFLLALLSLSQTTNFRLVQTGRVCSWQFQVQTARKHCGKRRNCSLLAISPFSTVFSKSLYCRHVTTRACLRKGYGSPVLLNHFKVENGHWKHCEKRRKCWLRPSFTFSTMFMIIKCYNFSHIWTFVWKIF